MKTSLFPAVLGFVSLVGSIAVLVAWQWILADETGRPQKSEPVRIFVRTGPGDRSNDWARLGTSPPAKPEQGRRIWNFGGTVLKGQPD